MFMQKNIFVSVVIFLFVFSALSPIVFGFSVRISNEKSKSSAFRDDGLMDSAWPMFHHDVRHTGRSQYGKSGNWFMEKWKTDIGGMVYSSPAIDKDGIIYIGSYDRYLIAVYPNGTEKWRFKTEEGIQSSPAIAEDGTIYVGSNDGYLYAINPNGTMKWKYATGDWVVSSPTISTDGMIYFGSYDNNIYALYPNGTLKWAYKTDYVVYPSPAIGEDGTVYCGSHDGNMYAIYTSNGSLKWKYSTGVWCGGKGATVSDDGIIYFGTVAGAYEGAYLYALNPNGILKWRLPLGSNVVSSPAIAEDGTIYVAAYKPTWGYNFYSISPEGSVNWRYESDAEAMSASPVIDKYGIIYIGDWDGVFYAFNSDGTIKWKYQTLNKIFPSAAIAEDGTIYVGAHSKTFIAYLYAIEPINNNPPEKPEITGQTNGKPRTEYTFTATTSDPDGDNLSYYFDWGDGKNSGWTEFVSSDSPVSRSHSWNWRGKYTIKVKAKDVYNMEGDWETLVVTIPHIKTTSINSTFLKLLEQFPMLQKLLKQLDFQY